MNNVETPRMRLVPGTAQLARLEVEDREGLGRALGADVPGEWPPETIRDAAPWFAAELAADPGLAGWLCWYGIARGAGPEPDTLVASGGFMGPPTDGAVEIGYSVLSGFQRRGLATEMAAALTDWALRKPEVERVTAEVDAKNVPSVRLLRRLGFAETGPGREPGHRRFERGRQVSGRPWAGRVSHRGPVRPLVVEARQGEKTMADDKDETVTMPWGEENPQDLTTGGAGSGDSPTDTGGLDASGNELGATSPGSRQGRSESKRMDEADSGARRP